MECAELEDDLGQEARDREYEINSREARQPYMSPLRRRKEFKKIVWSACACRQNWTPGFNHATKICAQK